MMKCSVKRTLAGVLAAVSLMTIGLTAASAEAAETPVTAEAAETPVTAAQEEEQTVWEHGIPITNNMGYLPILESYRDEQVKDIRVWYKPTVTGPNSCTVNFEKDEIKSIDIIHEPAGK